MSLLQAFVICFIAYLLYKLMKPSGVPKSTIDKLQKDISITFATIFKKASLENKATVMLCREDFYSGDPARIEAAIKKIEVIFDKDITDCEEILAKYNEKSDSTVIKDKL